MADVSPEPQSDPERSRLDRLLVGRVLAITRQHLRVAVVLGVGQAVFTATLWVLVASFGLPERNLIAFAAMLVLAGVGAAVVNGYRNGGLLVSVVLALAPLVGLAPVVVLQTGEPGDALLGTALVVAGFGVWAGVLGGGLGMGVRRLVDRYRP